MFKIHIRSKRESQQRSRHHDEDEFGTDDEMYGYRPPDDYEHQGRHEPEESLDTCCICGDTITNGHIVFAINSKDYEIHTSCLVTGMALITNGITILIGLLKQRFGRDKHLESEEN